MKSHEHHDMSNHRQVDCLFNCLFWPTSDKRHESPCYRSFARRGIHRLLEDVHGFVISHGKKPGRFSWFLWLVCYDHAFEYLEGNTCFKNGFNTTRQPARIFLIGTSLIGQLHCPSSSVEPKRSLKNVSLHNKKAWGQISINYHWCV